MKRSAFIGSLLGVVGIGRAQQWKQCTTGLTGTTGYITPIRCMEPHEHQEPPLNNQCPVCGAMAEPRSFWEGGMRTKQCNPPSADPYIVCADQTYYDPGPAITRCKHCNAAFWQDAER